MAKPGKSQWDFGELFPTETVRTVLTVSQLTGQVRRLLEKSLGQVWVMGEITNFRAQSSGHLYFTLKDADSQLSCVLFRNEAREVRDLLADGRKVLLQGNVTVYEPRGQYQLQVTAVELQGVGALQVAFEKLKQKLNAEGLFATARKRPIPAYARRIGIVTSADGAAIRDVLHVIQRRHPGLEIVLVSTRVQGAGAAGEIAAGIKLLNEHHRGATDDDSRLDLILITRGGGSLEDLWAFNEEIVARAIFESHLPVVSAVGHEIDFTIADFVADLRAATPSAAAELITEGMFSSRQFVEIVAARLRQLLNQRFEEKVENLAHVQQRLARLHPQKRFNEWLQRLDDLSGSLIRAVRQGKRLQQQRLENIWQRLGRLSPRTIIVKRREQLTSLVDRLDELTLRELQKRQQQLTLLKARLRLLGPQEVLARGYSITRRADTGAVVRSADQLKIGEEIITQLANAKIKSRVE